MHTAVATRQSAVFERIRRQFVQTKTHRGDMLARQFDLLANDIDPVGIGAAIRLHDRFDERTEIGSIGFEPVTR